MLNNSWNYRSILNENGQILVGSSTGNPLAAFLTSSSGTLSYSFGPGSINININGPISVGFGGTGRTLLTTYGVLLGEGSNGVNVTEVGTNGQILIGSSTGDPKFTTITSTGGSLTFTFGPNSLNLEVMNPSATSWSTISTSSTLQGGNAYICIGGGALTFALPPAPVIGTGVTLVLSGASSWTIVLSGTEVIRFGYLTTTTGAGGALQSSVQGDVVFLVCTNPLLSEWVVIYSIGTLQVF